MKVGRFQVMALLQAARAKHLGFSVVEAKSWGLNRAKFYAAAKRGFKGKKVPSRIREEIPKKPVEKGKTAYYLGDEMAYSSKKGGRLYFTLGETLQTESDFERQIMRIRKHLLKGLEGGTSNRAPISERNSPFSERLLSRSL